MERDTEVMRLKAEVAQLKAALAKKDGSAQPVVDSLVKVQAKPKPGSLVRGGSHRSWLAVLNIALDEHDARLVGL